MAERKGTRCAVCVGCGRCFEEEKAPGRKWSGKRCDVCVSCGECAKAWGLVSSGDPDDPDAVSGPTNWADAFKMMDTGSAGEAPPVIAPPGSAGDGDAPDAASGASVDAATGASVDAGASGADAGAQGQPRDAGAAVGGGEAAAPGEDAATGATPGVATACKELGLDDMASLGASLGIKPPGVS